MTVWQCEIKKGAVIWGGAHEKRLAALLPPTAGRYAPLPVTRCHGALEKGLPANLAILVRTSNTAVLGRGLRLQ